jgi:hypothetical protein
VLQRRFPGAPIAFLCATLCHSPEPVIMTYRRSTPGLGVSLLTLGLLAACGSRVEVTSTSGTAGTAGNATTTGGTAETCAAACGSDGGSGSTLWASLRGTSGQQDVQTLTVDAAGNVYVTGDLFGPDALDLGCGPLGEAQPGMFVAKLSPCGACLWSQAYSGAQAGPIAVGADGTVAVAGTLLGGTAEVAGHTLKSAAMSTFVASLAPDGTPRWVQAYDGESPSSCTPNGVAIDPSGNVLVGGTFALSVDFGGTTLTSDAGAAAFVGKLGPDGSPAWFESFGPNVNVEGLATDATGRLLFAGTFDTPVDFGCGELPGAPSAFVVALDPGGGCAFSRTFSGGEARPYNIGADASSSRIFVAGSFEGSVDLGGGPIAGGGLFSTFLAALDPEGTLIWAQGYTNVAGNATFDRAGNLFLVGDLSGPSNLGVGQSDSPDAIVVAGLDATGGPRWARTFAFPSAGSLSVGPIAAGAASGVVIGGGVGGTIDLGCGPEKSTSASDVYVAALAE